MQPLKPQSQITSGGVLRFGVDGDDSKIAPSVERARQQLNLLSIKCKLKQNFFEIIINN